MSSVSQQVKQHVTDNKRVTFDFYRNGVLYYKTENGFIFEVPTSDCGDAVFNKEDKALLFMRYIRKAYEALEAEKKGVENVKPQQGSA